ncbi:MAG: hypothetical protein ACPKM1_15660 [Spirochaetaceae bacterium]
MDKVKIGNMAIGFCGGNSIMSFEDGTTESDLCKINYEPARDYCLEMRDWTFASERRRLTPLADAPVSEFSHAFQLPSDCFVLRQVSDNQDMKSSIEYQVDGNRILCDAGIVYVRYTVQVTNTSLFSPSFALAVATKLAELISVALTASPAMKQAYEQGSERLLEDSGAIDGMQGTPKRAYASRLLSARRGAYSHMGQPIYDWGY